MLRKKAIAKFVEACESINLSDTAILNALVDFVENAAVCSPIPQVKILEEGEVAHPL